MANVRIWVILHIAAKGQKFDSLVCMPA